MSNLLQNHMSTSHTIRAHAQKVWDKSDNDYFKIKWALSTVHTIRAHAQEVWDKSDKD